jgi:hypothetical protein
MFGDDFHLSVHAHQHAYDSGSYASDLRRSLRFTVRLLNMGLCDNSFNTSSQPFNLEESKYNLIKLKKPKSELNK